ncbi:MAG: DUF1786 domain-containing protein [bacterium]
MGSLEPLLALDVGSGTQDLFLWDPEQVTENCLQMVLPSPTRMLAKKVRDATSRAVPIHLKGFLMGGGPVAWAIREHAKAGLGVTAEPKAALTLHDNLEHVEEMGIRILEEPPENCLVIRMGDIQRELLAPIFEMFEIPEPRIWCVAVQDHGHQPHGSNREFRFQHWRKLLEEGGEISRTLYRQPPSYMTRMLSVLEQVPQGLVMDTGMAAVHGAMCDPLVEAALDSGVLIVNLGNQHTLGALVTRERIWGLFEHHTGALGPESLKAWMDRFRLGLVDSVQVMEDGGHGCAYHPEGLERGMFQMTVVTGPRRELASTLGWHMAAPLGNMMLSGCFGMVRAYLQGLGVVWP